MGAEFQHTKLNLKRNLQPKFYNNLLPFKGPLCLTRSVQRWRHLIYMTTTDSPTIFNACKCRLAKFTNKFVFVHFKAPYCDLANRH